VIRNLEIIGQALKDYGINELNQIRPDMAWHQISAMRMYWRMNSLEWML